MIPVIKPFLGEEEALAAAEVVRSGWVAQGPRVGEFEKQFALAQGAGHGVAVSNCTTGLHLAMHVLGLSAGDEVVIPSFSFIATTNVVRYVGATPVFCDVDPNTGNVTAETIAAVITPRTRAVIAVHQGGMPFDVDSVQALCDEHGIQLVHDSACAAGSTYKGKPVSSTANLAAWSFHPRKLLTTGEGGMVTTNDADLAVRLRKLREHGMSVSAADRHAQGSVKLEEYEEVAFNYRMTDMQAAVGLIQLSKLDGVIARRRELAERYHKLLPEIEGLRFVTDPEYGTTNYQSFWVVLPDSVEKSVVDVLTEMSAKGISGRRGIMAAHLEPAYAGTDEAQRAELPATEHLTRRSLILPLFHQMTDAEHDQVVAALAGAVK
ncbi:glutamine--scyllo-inositol aminotransferase [Lentzea guizhouensis]|uniref:Glutamine--scyllo-inositol aminotransferase n=1 Tax=Lentzea guizhouensis TaxID=1586287 RepID=A0A1B2HGY8_9PSEU|nr:DegT/DnrJ/EryC1/StrS family aminotransferase [Lentzea guizhouensis]ANZ36980.1 glutamine--scyllo-inositol aminotransferase [Lentzea guizhouensis]